MQWRLKILSQVYHTIIQFIDVMRKLYIEQHILKMQWPPRQFTICKDHCKKIIVVIFSVGISAVSISQVNVMTFMTSATPPVNPFIADYILSSNVRSNFMATVSDSVKISGQITCTSPFFTITLKPASRPFKQLLKGVMYNLDMMEKAGAFGGFMAANLDISGISVSSITDANGRLNRLPDGNYNICFSAWTFNNAPISTGGC